MHSIVFLTQITKVQIHPNKNMVRLTAAIPQSLLLTSAFITVSVAVKKYNDHRNSYKARYLIKLAYTLRGLAYYNQGWTWQYLGGQSSGVAENSTS